MIFIEFIKKYLGFAIVSESSLEVDVIGHFGGIAGYQTETCFLRQIPNYYRH